MVRILIVDDEESLRNLYSEFLSSNGHEVAAVEDGAKGVELYRSLLSLDCLPDLILSDVTMPNLSGIEMLAQIEKLRTEAGLSATPFKVIVATGGYSDTLGQIPKNYATIAKPFRPIELVTLVETVLKGAVKETVEPSRIYN